MRKGRDDVGTDHTDKQTGRHTTPPTHPPTHTHTHTHTHTPHTHYLTQALYMHTQTKERVEREGGGDLGKGQGSRQ